MPSAAGAKTIRQYAIERLFPADPNADAAWKELKTLLGQRISDGLGGAVSSKSIYTIVDEELGREGL